MGVSRKEPANLTPIRVEETEENNYADYDLSESGDEFDYHTRRISVEQLHSRTSRNRANKKPRNIQRKFHDELETDGVNVKRNMGARKWRRVEHARIMLTFTDLEDICEDCTDICGETFTAFSKLFVDKENMRTWNEFIEKDEKEQLRILESKGNVYPKSEARNDDMKTSPPKKSTISEADGRKHHPAYSGKSCYNRIDKRSRSVLMGRRVNWALIDHLERELNSLFSNSQSSGDNHETVFVGTYPASSDRLLAHIVSQYMFLDSQSITDPETGERITEIRNLRPFFIPPHVSLITYLEEHVLRRTIEFVPYDAKESDEPNVSKLSISSSSSSDGDWIVV